MANYECVVLTNEFRVTDENRYAELVKNLYCDNGYLRKWKSQDLEGNTLHGFGADGSVDYRIEYVDDNNEACIDWNFDEFLSELQNILPDGERFVFKEVGNEKLCYVTGVICVVTNKFIEWRGLDDLEEMICKEHKRKGEGK